MELDTTDFLILRSLKHADRPLWKNKLHEQQSDLFSEPVSVQTVGRRVDRLQKDGLLGSCIISPDDIKRDLIIAFKLTDDGHTALKQKRQQLLRQEVQNDLFQENPDSESLPDSALIQLICDEFNMNEQAETLLHERYGREELTTFLLLYFTRSEISNVFADESLATVTDLAKDCPELMNALDTDIQNMIAP